MYNLVITCLINLSVSVISYCNNNEIDYINICSIYCNNLIYYNNVYVLI